MTLWGIYYELANFANFQFMSSIVPRNIRTAAWGFTGMFASFAWFLGPFVANWLLQHGIIITQGTLIIFLLASLVLVIFSKNKRGKPNEAIDLAGMSPGLELKHWIVLAKSVWPALIIYLLLGIIDATFYTVGAIWTEKLARISPWGVWFLPMYLLPFMCLGVPLSTWKISNGKKKLAEKLLIISGILFICMAVSSSIQWQLLIVCLASCGVAICYPLINGVFTDILDRMGKEKKDMIGLTSSITNISYIVWPVFAGIIASKVGERLTFSYLGVLILVISIVLLFVTPRKLKLPQTEIRDWG
jgi:MFS family permease